MRLKLSKRYNPTKRKLNPAWEEFDGYQRKNYSVILVQCLCGDNENHYLISTVSKEGLELPLVICKSCGLIRAKYYWDEKYVNDFYTNWYPEIYGSREDVNKFYEDQRTTSPKVWNFVYEYICNFNERYTVVDVGGGAGGKLDSFIKEAQCYLLDFNKSLLAKANAMGIFTIEGGLDKLNETDIKPDLVILSHVVEHFVDVHKEFRNLKKQLKIGSLVYIELPGIDALKDGKKRYDFMHYIRAAHVYYFSLGVLNNLMNRYGFRCLKSNTQISALYEYTGEIGELVNQHDIVCSLIQCAEMKRKLGFFYIRKYISKVLKHSGFKAYFRYENR